MELITVDLKERTYPVIIGGDILPNSGKFIKKIPDITSVFIITNKKIKNLYGAKLAQSLQRAQLQAHFLQVADTEKSKSIATWINAIYNISAHDKDRASCVVALGGGVIGDLAGFVAACYRRGVPLVQIPTTLLAQVDSSIGGKTAVDLPFAKNLIGAFYQPKMVISDVKLLKSLPAFEIRNGMAEIIKYAVIMDKSLFYYLENNLKRLMRLDEKPLSDVILRCSQLKAKVVSADEKEISGYRSILNFGHTIGHAIEAAASYTKKITHGQAVATGMLCACDIATDTGLLKKKEAERIEALIKAAGLAAITPRLSTPDIFNAMSYDKKIVAGKLKFILPVSIGHAAVCTGIDKKIIRKAIDKRLRV